MGLLVLLVLGGVGVYVMKPEERLRAARAVLRPIEDVWFAVQDERARKDPFRDALSARTPRPVLAWTIAAMNAVIFVMGGHGDPDTLVRWGGSVAPLTTGGDWWRLLTAPFVHAGFIALVVSIAGFLQPAMLIERLLGPVALATVFLSGGILSTVIHLSNDPLEVSAGATGAVLAVYGTLLAVVVRGALRPSEFTIPRQTLRLLAPASGVFLLHALWTGDLTGQAGLVPLATGFVFGIVLASTMAEGWTPAWRTAAMPIATAVIAAFIGVPLRGVMDARPDIARVVVEEDATTRDYASAIAQFKLGALKAEAVAQIIERRIEPVLMDTQTRLRSLTHVPPDQEPLLTAANDFVALRIESWQLRAKALHKSNMRMLREADDKERASLALLDKIRPPA
jgi:rhomboid protease GluP